LKFAFDDTVPIGFVIPFGAFRRVLDQPIEPGGASAWNWMKGRYAQIDRARGDEKKQLIAETLERLRSWIKQVDPGAGFEAQLRWNLDQHFGTDEGVGVFVRSDTNVEDLPGFTGAGLNQTIPNVIGYDAILQAIREVWSSPFTERAYSWRQSHEAADMCSRPSWCSALPSKSGVILSTSTGDRPI
jgi:phosphoenolpyruvate synthase/pyruvate phosphate dikinase